MQNGIQELRDTLALKAGDPMNGDCLFTHAAQHIRKLEAENADLRKIAHCRYPRCVDYSEDQRCVEWLMGDCPGPPDEEPQR